MTTPSLSAGRLIQQLLLVLLRVCLVLLRVCLDCKLVRKQVSTLRLSPGRLTYVGGWDLSVLCFVVFAASALPIQGPYPFGYRWHKGLEKKKAGVHGRRVARRLGRGIPGEYSTYLHRFRAFRRPGDMRNKSVRETYVRRIRRDTWAEKEGKGQGQRGCKETGERGSLGDILSALFRGCS